MLFVRPATNRHGAKAHLSRVLHAEVAKPADSLDGDGVAGTPGVTECVEGGNSGADQRGRFFRFEFVRYQR